MTSLLAAAEAEYRALISSVEFAYAFGHGCSIDGRHRRFIAIRERADHLLSIIREHTPREI
jgi:hypothetical protein